MVDVLTDNRNRTNGEIRKIFERHGGNMGGPGCVGFLFERKGAMFVDAARRPRMPSWPRRSKAGAEDMKLDGPTSRSPATPPALIASRRTWKSKASSSSALKSPSYQDLADADTGHGQTIMRLLEALDDHDDVQHVYTNLNVTDAMIAE